VIFRVSCAFAADKQLPRRRSAKSPNDYRRDGHASTTTTTTTTAASHRRRESTNRRPDTRTTICASRQTQARKRFAYSRRRNAVSLFFYAARNVLVVATIGSVFPRHSASNSLPGPRITITRLHLSRISPSELRATNTAVLLSKTSTPYDRARVAARRDD